METNTEWTEGQWTNPPSIFRSAPFWSWNERLTPDRLGRQIEEMRSGRRDVARFWIDLAVPPGTAKHKILIEFYALRSPAGQYLGCMEHTQDVEHIRGLSGQKKLLD